MSLQFLFMMVGIIVVSGAAGAIVGALLTQLVLWIVDRVRK